MVVNGVTINNGTVDVSHGGIVNLSAGNLTLNTLINDGTINATGSVDSITGAVSNHADGVINIQNGTHSISPPGAPIPTPATST